METSEDDAGASTNASRRVSAREKDVVQVEDVNTSDIGHQDSSEPQASCEIPIMSEDNFDGDSVPSPSTQDVNTSTEAILDMIDEIVDGPGAPKRLNLTLEENNDNKLDEKQHPLVTEVCTISPILATSESTSAALSKDACESECDSENKTVDKIIVDSVKPEDVSDQVNINESKEIKSDIELKPSSSKLSLDNSQLETSSSSEIISSVQTGKVCEPSESTVQSVVLTDNKNKVYVESAVSTSSDNSSEGRDSSVSVSTRSPLRRRLVRPVPSRPDSTVSSSVDSSVISDISQSEYVVKDVSSSSDIVPPVNESKPEEIKNVSEVSICRAETSISSPKKIKLIRQKIISQVSNVDNVDDKQNVNNDHCQSPSSNTQCMGSESSHKPLLDNSTQKVNVALDINFESLNAINDPCLNKAEDSSQSSLQDTVTNELVTEIFTKEKPDDECKKVPPIKLNLSTAVSGSNVCNSNDEESSSNTSDTLKQVPKLTIKISGKQSEELKSPVPKLTIKPIRPPELIADNDIPCDKLSLITKLNIKPIHKHAEKVNEIHRKSSSSEISESECSENDETTSTSDQASTSDQCSSDVVPKVTIKLGKPGTDAEGKFYMEKNIPKLTIKTIQNSENEGPISPSKLKVIISQSQENQPEKIPKLTIKTVPICDNEQLSPKMTIKTIRPQEDLNKDSSSDQDSSSDIAKTKNEFDSVALNEDIKETFHVPKITIKPIAKPDNDYKNRFKKSQESIDLPVITKLNIKPIVKPADSLDLTENVDDKVPVVSKLNIKPIIKPKNSELDSSKHDISKIAKLNIKTPMSSDINSCEETFCDDTKIDKDDTSIPVITKINIKPIIKPIEEDPVRNIDNLSKGHTSETSTEHIPIISKINIKPISKTDNINESNTTLIKKDDDIPFVTKLNIKPLVKPEDTTSPSSPKRETFRRNVSKPVVTKLNIKPLVKPDDLVEKINDESSEISKNPPIVMKINRKVVDTYRSDNQSNDHNEYFNNIDKDDQDSSKDLKSSKQNVHTNLETNELKELDNIAVNCSQIPTTSITKTENEPGQDNLEEHIQMSQLASNELKNCISKSEIVKHVNLGIIETSDLSRPSQDNLDENIQMSQLTSSEIKNCVSKSEIVKHVNLGIIETSDLSKQNTDQESVNVHDSDTSKFPCTNVKTTDTPDDIEKINDISNIHHINDSSSDLQSTILSKVMNQKSKLKNASLKKNCTLLKKLLENKSESIKDGDAVNAYMIKPLDDDVKKSSVSEYHEHKYIKKQMHTELNHDGMSSAICNRNDLPSNIETNQVIVNVFGNQNSQINEHLVKPLEVNVSDKIGHHSSDQDSPRIILKINKTDQGASAQIITEVEKLDQQDGSSDISGEFINDIHQNKSPVNSKKKTHIDTPMPVGKRLRSSRVVHSTDKGPLPKQILNKRPSSESNSPQQERKEQELSLLETKRLKLGQILSNKSLTTAPILSNASSSPTKNVEIRQDDKIVNHTILNNENCAKNGSSKLHNILSNLQATQLHNLPYNDLSDRKNNESPDFKSSTSTGSMELESEENSSIEKSRPGVHEMMFQENSESRDYTIASEDMSQDPLEVETKLKAASDYLNDNLNIPKPVEMTPQPKRRGRPRKIPLSEGSRPVVNLPVSALEERPQRSLRLSRERPIVILKPRGRGRGRGRGRVNMENNPSLEPGPIVDTANRFFEQKQEEDIDPTSSRIKLPRMTEALDKLPSSTPLTSRRRNSSSSDMFDNSQDFKDDQDTSLPKMENPFLKSPEILSEGRGRPLRGRGSRGGRMRAAARTPRGRGRGRGGGRGAMYMKETMGIYGRVCGPATTTVQLFEEETCMMDDNATPSKPSHLLDEDSQSSVKSSTNESSKMKKSKFADLFDSNKVWTAADVKEYSWPLAASPADEQQIMMIQEQVAMFLGVKSFKRRYPELKRRTITGEERNYLLRKGIVTEALCDLGITAVDASEVLDIMLSDYPHKYEEYRSHQRVRQLNEPEEEEVKPEVKVEVKTEQKNVDTKPDLPKVDPEKMRLEMATAAVASASEWNARMNAMRRGACADLQSLTVLRRRPQRPAAAPAPTPRVRPPAGFYPHALLPGQYQHSYRHYTPEELRYFPLNTVLAVPPAPLSPVLSSSDSEPEWGSRYTTSEDSDTDTHRNAKRKKLTKTKRNSQAEAVGAVSAKEEVEVDTCRACNLRLEANRKYTHERFLVCVDCNAKLHPSCVELGPDTIRKAREYAWQCAACKTCGVCGGGTGVGGGAADRLLFCDLCDRGFHTHCLGLPATPNGRWHCVECSICKSCGARTPGGLGAEGAGPSVATAGAVEPHWHHQTRRGPGGHKVYSHSLCTPCARAYRIGRYCPLCERSFIGPKGTMQLVICKLCDRQLHQECVRPTVSQLKVLDYTCGDCRRGGITSRAAAVRLAPRTIATLFMAKRRFNKYAHRQYMQSRMARADADAEVDADADADADTAERRHTDASDASDGEQQ